MRTRMMRMTSWLRFTHASTEFPYESLATLGDTLVKSYCEGLRQRFQKRTKLANAHEEWFFRTHVAVKLILSSTVMLSSARYAVKKGLRMVEPYLSYYALLNTSRALVLMIPEQEWRDGELFEATHQKVRNVAADQLRCVSTEKATEYRDLVQRALLSRELFSYRFPAEGLKGDIARSLPDFDQTVSMCRYIGEVAQLHSECLEAAFSSLGRPMGDFSEDALRGVFEYESQHLGRLLHDSDDYQRLGSALVKVGRPVSLSLTATEGLVEDFFGAWDFSEDALEGEDEDRYVPHTNEWDLIFPFH